MTDPVLPYDRGLTDPVLPWEEAVVVTSDPEQEAGRLTLPRLATAWNTGIRWDNNFSYTLPYSPPEPSPRCRRNSQQTWSLW